MATGGLGGLVVSLGLDAAEYVKGLSKAEHETKRAVEEIKGTVTKIAGAFGVGLSISAFKGMIEGALEAEAALYDLGKRAGITGEQLSALSPAARRSHTDLQTVADMSARLSKGLLEAGESTSKVGTVLRALGFGAQDLARFLDDPANAMLEIGKRLNDLPESGTKAGASLLLLGRGGASASAFLAELSKQTTLVATRTQEEIVAAKELEDRFSDLQAKSSKLKVTLANALVPTLEDVLTAIESISKGANSAQSALSDMAKSGDIQEFAQDAAIALATVAETLLLIVRVAKGIPDEFRLIAADLDVLLKASNAPKMKPFGALGFSAEEATKANAELDDAVDNRNRILKRMQKDQEDFDNYNVTFLTDSLKKSFQVRAAMDLVKPEAGLSGGLDMRDVQANRRREQLEEERKRAAKAREDAVRKALADQAKGGHEAKALLDQQVKEQEDAIKNEQEALRDRQHYLDSYYRDDLISLQDYYTERTLAINSAAVNIRAAYDKEIEALQSFIDDKKNKEEARIRAETELAQVREKRARFEKDVEVQRFDADAQKTRDVLKLKDAVTELDAQLKELAGDFRGAAEARFDVQTRSQTTQARLTLQSPGATPGEREQAQHILDANAALRQQKGAQAEVNAQAQKYTLLQGDLAAAQARINLAVESGNKTSLDGINERSALARRYVDILTAQVDAEELAAQKLLPGPERDAQLAHIRDMRLAIDQLAESANELEKIFRTTFVDAFASNLTDAITGTKTFSQAIKDMEKQVVGSITRMAAQNIGETLFGKQGPLGGRSEFLAKIFGGGKTVPGIAGPVDVGKVGTVSSEIKAAMPLAEFQSLGISAGLVDTGFTTIGATSTILDAAMITLSASADIASAALLTMAGSEAGKAGGDIVGAIVEGIANSGGAYAEGGAVRAGRTILVGEKGPELFSPYSAGTITPNDELGGKSMSNNVTVNVAVQGNVSRATADQVAMRSGIAVQRALRKNG